MGKKNKFEERKSSLYQRELRGIEIKKALREPHIVLSFRDFDINQGQSFVEWQRDELLALAIDKLRQICQLTVAQAIQQQIVKIYTKVDFPPESKFKHPKHVSPDVKWASFHIQGKECVIGYFEDNIFHVVFLDKDHEFWITQKKHT